MGGSRHPGAMPFRLFTRLAWGRVGTDVLLDDSILDPCDPAHAMMAPPSTVVIDAVFGRRTEYDPTVKRLADLPQDIMCRICSNLSPRSLCNLGASLAGLPRRARRVLAPAPDTRAALTPRSRVSSSPCARAAQVSKSASEVAEDDSIWRSLCACGRPPSLGGCCKEHVRDEHLRRKQCEQLFRLLQAEERRRRTRARLRKLKQLLLPLLQGVFVLFLFFFPWADNDGSTTLDSHAARAGAGGSPARAAGCGSRGAGAVRFQYGAWHARHELSPTIRAASA